MRILIAEDDLTSRMFLQRSLEKYGQCDVAVNGIEVIDLVSNSLLKNEPYDLICLDIMMPKVDGIKALSTIRLLEDEKLPTHFKPSIIIMTTALSDKETVEKAYSNGCDAYAWKPIEMSKFETTLRELELIS
jgi:two-component system chemotaxis response regulator CheY